MISSGPMGCSAQPDPWHLGALRKTGLLGQKCDVLLLSEIILALSMCQLLANCCKHFNSFNPHCSPLRLLQFVSILPFISYYL